MALEEQNFLGRGQKVRASVTYGERTQGYDFSFTEPYFLGQRISAGIDLFSKFNDNKNIGYYESRLNGGAVRLGFPMTENFTLTGKYSLFLQEVDVPARYRTTAQRMVKRPSRSRSWRATMMAF